MESLLFRLTNNFCALSICLGVATHRVRSPLFVYKSTNNKIKTLEKTKNVYVALVSSIHPKNERIPIKRQTDAILPIFKKVLSVFDSCLLTSTLYGIESRTIKVSDLFLTIYLSLY